MRALPARVNGSGRLRAAMLFAACLPWLGAGAGWVHAAERNDPFDTARQRPAVPSQFWNGPTTSCANADKVPDPMRLVDSIDLALCNNPLTRQSWANAKAQAALVGVARAAYLPELSAAASLQRIETRNLAVSNGGQTVLNANLSLNYLLFDFGGRDATLDQAQQSLQAADWTHNATLQSVLLGAVQSYYQLYATQQAVQSTLASEKASLASLEAARARQRVGSATRADTLQAQTAYSQAQLNRTQAEGDAATARGVLANALGLSAERELRIAPPPDLEAQKVAERAVTELLEVAKTKRPDLAAAQAQVRAAESNIKVQEAAGKPNVSVFATAGATQASGGLDPRTGILGVQLNIPLFTGYRTTYQIVQAREQLEAQVASRDKLVTDVSLDVWRAYQDLRTQDQSLATATELTASAQESYDVALARYKAGVGTITDLLNAQSALANAQLQKIQARYRWNVAKVTLARAIGVLEPNLVAEHTPSQSSPNPQ